MTSLFQPIEAFPFSPTQWYLWFQLPWHSDRQGPCKLSRDYGTYCFTEDRSFLNSLAPSYFSSP